MIKYSAYLISLVVGLAGMLMGCVDDGPSALVYDEGVNLVINIPAAGLQIDADPGTATSVTEAEGRITSLWFFAFPVDDDGTRLARRLDPQNDNVLTDGINYVYQFKMNPGKYHVYVIANYDPINGLETEADLRAYKILYKDGQAVQLPSLSNGSGLPMVYENLGDLETGVSISSSGESPVVLKADMQFTCVKVTYQIQFDTKNAADFGGNGLRINTVSANNVADYTWLVDNAEGHYDVSASLSQHVNADFEGNGSTSWTMTGTLYLPEHYVKNAEQTYLQIEGEQTNSATGASTGDKVSYRVDLGEVAQSGVSQFLRGTHYHITGKVTTAGLLVNPTITVSDWTLESIAIALGGPYHLRVDRTSIARLTAGDVAVVHYDTDVPQLKFESPEINVDGVKVPIFEATADNSTNTISIGLNPELPFGKEIPAEDSYIYVIAGELKKKITIGSVRNIAYLKVTPAVQTVYVREIVNSGTTYTVSFTYTTNLPQINISNTNKNAYLMIDSGTLENHRGTVTCTLQYPYPDHFPSNATVNFSYAATDGTTSLSASSQLAIIAYSTSGYHLHFRPKGDGWTNPHIYVYDPLLTPDGLYVRFGISASEKENALLYGFTGKVTFLGWNTQAGNVGVPTNHDAVGTEFDPGSQNADVYNFSIDYCPEYRMDCCATGFNLKWPGVKMKKDPDNSGWYIFDLPALATPGRTLIMFADGHTPSSDTENRYPGHMVPGVPLYDFEDKDGWFYYDKDKDYHEFVDDKPEVDDLPDLSKGRFRIWIKSSSYTGYTNAYVWDSVGKYQTVWPGMEMGIENNIRYIEVDGSQFSFTTNVNVILSKNGGNDKTGDLSVGIGDFRNVDGKQYIYEADL